MQYMGKSQFPMLNNAIHGQVIKNLLSFNSRQQDWNNLEILFGPKSFVILDWHLSTPDNLNDIYSKVIGVIVLLFFLMT